MNILITGVSGMLGQKIYQIFKATNANILGIARKHNKYIDSQDVLIGDLSDANFITKLPKYFLPNVIIHAAAIVDVNYCENNKLYTELVHIRSGELLAKTYPNATFVYLSTDSVFDGVTGGYEEESLTNPLNFYAYTKLQGEGSIKLSQINSYILRFNIYGFHLPASNSLFEWAITNLKNNNRINGFENVYFNPLYNVQIAALIKEIVYQKLPFGTYNLCCDKFISKYDFILKVANKFNLNSNLIQPIQAVPQLLGAKRPLNTTLKNDKIKSFLVDFDFSLDAGLEQLYTDYNQYFYENN